MQIAGMVGLGTDKAQVTLVVLSRRKMEWRTTGTTTLRNQFERELGLWPEVFDTDRFPLAHIQTNGATRTGIGVKMILRHVIICVQ
jgi:hypothetical protein